MAAPPWHSLTAVQGDSLVLVLRHEQAVGGVMAPVDVSSRTYQAAYRESFDAPEGVSFTVDASEAAQGIIKLMLSPAQTAGLRRGVWDVVETSVEEGQTTLLQGEVHVRQRVTR